MPAWALGDRVRPITAAPTWTNERGDLRGTLLEAGVYEIHAVDEYPMCGFIEVRDGVGNVWPVEPRYLEWVSGP